MSINLKELRLQRNRELAAAYEAGIPADEMARMFGVSAISCATIARTLGARRPRRGPLPKKERNEKMCAAYMSGRSLEEVGQEHGITRERVRQILVKNGIEERHQGFMSDRRVISREKAYPKLLVKAERAERLAARRELARQLYDSGSTYQQIAEQLSCGIGWVQSLIWATGGPNRNPSARKPKRKLTAEEKAEIGRQYSAGENIGVIAQQFGIVISYVPHVAHAVGAKRP